jgi:glycerol dehydrogenase
MSSFGKQSEGQMKDLFTIANPHYLMQTAPVQYLNSEGSSSEFGKHIAAWGDTALICGGNKALAAVEGHLVQSLEQARVRWERVFFPGECSAEIIAALAENIEKMGANILVGVGGGKCLDAAKAAAWVAGVPVVCVPTIAATCAAATALSILYTSDGAFERALYLPSSPNLVLIDPAVIANAPGKYLASGMFDSLAKWYEGQSVLQGIPRPDALTEAAVQLTEFLYHRIKRQGAQAMELVRRHRTGKELQDVIDVNIYLTGTVQGLGLYTLRGGAAHALHNGLTAIKTSHGILHGFKVGYGIVVQHFLERRPINNIKETIQFFRLLGLEPKLSSLCIHATNENIRTIAKVACSDEAMQKMSFPVSERMVISAIRSLEAQAQTI